MDKEKANAIKRSEQENLRLFRERLARLQAENNVSNRNLSTPIGVSDNYIQRTVTGAMTPALEKIFRICDFFDMTPCDFFDFDQSPSSVEQRFQACARKLNDSEKQAIIKIILAVLDLRELSADQ